MMRTLPDRIRHTLLFEIIALTIVTFAGSWITGHSPEAIGSLGLIFSALAMVWNLTYNWLFDLWDQKYRNSAPRTVPLRVVHAILFEAVLLIVGMFIIAWWLEVGLVEAAIMDVGLSVFFLFYAFGFNWSYDVVFPVPKAA